MMIRALQVLVFVFLLASWEIAGRASTDVAFNVGYPSRIGGELWKLVWEDNMLFHFYITGAEALCGLILGTLVGSVFGLLLWYSKAVEKVLRPYTIAFGSMPVLALAPLMIIWFGIGFGMKVALAAFSTVFIGFNQAHRGAMNIESKYVDMLLGMGATRHQVFVHVIVPGSLDAVFSALRLSVGFALLGAFIGEFIAADQGLGHLILKASSLYNTPRALAAGLGIVLLAFLFDRAARYVEDRKYLLVQLFSVPRIIWRGF